MELSIRLPILKLKNLCRLTSLLLSDSKRKASARPGPSTGGKDFVLLGSTDVVLSNIKCGPIACNGGVSHRGGFGGSDGW